MTDTLGLVANPPKDIVTHGHFQAYWLKIRVFNKLNIWKYVLKFKQESMIDLIIFLDDLPLKVVQF